MNFRFALAVGQDQHLVSQHFGDATHFLILDLADGVFSQTALLDNPVGAGGGHHNHDHDHPHDHHHGHGHGKKAAAIAAFLMENGVQAIVSGHYGPNVARISELALPILLAGDTLDEIQAALVLHFPVILSTWENRAGFFPILRIKDGAVQPIEVKPKV